MQVESAPRLDASLELVEPHLPRVLMAPESLALIRRVTHALPLFAVDFFGFECKLGTQPGLTDCALNLLPDGARMLAGRHSVASPAELQGSPWDRIRRFYQEWGDTRQPAYVDAPSTWLEFDTSQDKLAPNLLFGYWPRQTEAQRPLEWLVDTIVPLLLGKPVSLKFRQSLAHCLNARPPETNDFQVGMMLSRDLQVVRVCVFDLPRKDVLPYLDRVGWKGDGAQLCEYLDAFRPHADFIGLHLDVGEEVYPHIGVEPNFKAGCWTRQPHREPRWEGQFEQLQRFGLLTPEKKQALLSWIGHQNIAIGEQEILLVRGLSHIKIVLRPGAQPVAKGYFGITHRALGNFE